MKRQFILFAVLFVTFVVGFAQGSEELTITVHADNFDRLNAPVCAQLPPNLIGANAADMYELTATGDQPVPVQIDESGQLCWLLSGDTPAGTIRQFKLRTISHIKSDEATGMQKMDGRYAFLHKGKEIITYQSAPAPVPPGVDPIYSRGGFVHPIMSPAGDTLSRIQPPDHYHHYGLWNPWTHVEYDGREVDFWNLNRRHGTVAPVANSTIFSQGSVYAALTTQNEYLAYADTITASDPQKLLEEQLSLRTYPVDSTYLIDYTSDQHNPTELPFIIKAYRYQGLGFRARADWDDETANLLTSEGFDKANANATRARWMRVSGPTEHGTAGILFMAHPNNYNSPETIRIWPEGANGGRENVFVNFNPAQDRDYRLRPGGRYTLKYRMLVYNGELDTVRASAYWQDFAYPPRVTIEGENKLAGKRILLYTKNGKGFVHDNIPASIAAIEQLGRENNFMVRASEDPTLFNPDSLAKFDVLVFSNTNNDIFDTPDQETAFKNYMTAGGGFVGIHSACGSERNWPWFWRNLGGRFFRHAERQDFDVTVVDANHPSTDFLPPTWHIKDDECYYLKQLNPAIHVLLAADLDTVDDEQGSTGYPSDTFGSNFPTSWCHKTDGGRQWYTSLGHRIEHYSDPVFMRHILGGIEWASLKSNHETKSSN